jgi:uncharacterized membrane protein YtjA (UPF0391 family)
VFDEALATFASRAILKTGVAAIATSRGARFEIHVALVRLLEEGELTMLRWALVFLLVGLLAGVFGFYWLEGPAMWFARVLFFVFLVLLIVSLVMGRRPRL